MPTIVEGHFAYCYCCYWRPGLIGFRYPFFVLQEEQYSRWMAACKLGSKGKTLADSSYETEVRTIQTFLTMQHRSPTPAINPSAFEITPQDYVAPRFLKKIKGKVRSHLVSSLRTTGFSY
jgi:hypothetical protein